MKKVIHLSEERGKGEYGWLKTRYSFSFADWYNPERMGFGALRVINDDTIAPNSGFGIHSHRDIEIITIVTAGTLTHKDSMGNVGTVSAGEVQVMSAGINVAHSEYNSSKEETLSLFQIWINPKETGGNPRYGQKSFKNEKSGITTLVSPMGHKEGLNIKQDAYIYYAVIESIKPLHHKLAQKNNGAYVFVIEGSVNIGEDTLSARDAMGVWETEEVTIVNPVVDFGMVRSANAFPALCQNLLQGLTPLPALVRFR